MFIKFILNKPYKHIIRGGIFMKNKKVLIAVIIIAIILVIGIVATIIVLGNKEQEEAKQLLTD